MMNIICEQKLKSLHQYLIDVRVKCLEIPDSSNIRFPTVEL